MSFGNQTSGTKSSTTPALPPNTPTNADPSVITAGLAGFNPSQNIPALSTKFTSLVGGAGGVGRPTIRAKRSLIGGAS